MKIEEVEKLLMRNSSSLIRKEGRRIYGKGLVKRLEGKKINEFYSVYGEVETDSVKKTENTYIRINMKSKSIDRVKCSCETYRNISVGKRNFMCSHIIATLYRFINSVKTKENKKSKAKAQVIVSKEMPLKISNNQEDKSIEKPIKVLQEQSNKDIYKIIRKKNNDKIVYEFRENLGRGKEILSSSDLRQQLEKHSFSKIKFTYDTLEVITSIRKNNLPIGFTLKEEAGKLVVTSYKKMPISLTEKNDVFFFNNELYLPSRKQIKEYEKIIDKIKDNGKIVLDLNIENYNNIMLKLGAITDNIILRDEIKAFAENYMDIELRLYGKALEVFGDVYIGYGKKKVNILKDDFNPLRNEKKEEEVITRICNFGFMQSNNNLKFIGTDEELFYILKGLNNRLKELCTVKIDGNLQKKLILGANALDVNLESLDDEYKVTYNIDNIAYDELYCAYECYKNGDEYYKTSYGFIDFSDDGIKALFSLLKIGNSNKENEIILDKNKGIILSEIIRKIPHVKGLETIEDIKKVIEEEIEVPKEFKGDLRPYQLEGYRWLKTLSKLNLGGILADEMGLGKTIQVIAFMLSEKDKRFLIACPTSLIFNWKNEIEKFAPSIKIGIAHGNKRNEVLKNIEEFDCILTTYGTLKIDKEQYKTLRFDYFIIDEAQNIKNSKAEVTKCVKLVNSKMNFALTGTPLENNLLELWSIFDFVMKGYLFSKEEFKFKFMRGNAELDELKVLISPFILRRRKSEVLKDLQEKIERHLLVKMTKNQEKVYKMLIKEAKENSSLSENQNDVFAYLTRLREVCLDPKLVYEEYEGDSGKVKEALKIIKSSKGKILLFSQFTSLLDSFGKKLEEKGIVYSKIDGKTSPKTRIERVEEFNRDKDIKVMLISLKAGGYGLNLTSAHKVIHFDPWWNPAVEDQASDRAHRIGQKNIVEVVKLVAKGTIEEKIILLQEDKKKLIDNILTGELQEANLTNKLTKDEIIKLIF